jgi:hypothetical protein
MCKLEATGRVDSSSTISEADKDITINKAGREREG